MFTTKPTSEGAYEEDENSAEIFELEPGDEETAARAPTSTLRKALNRISRSVIGQGLRVTGNIACDGELQVEGTIDGDIDCKSIVVGDLARVNGAVTAERVVVNGNITGNIYGLHVKLQANAQVKGEIQHGTLAVEQGAIFDGTSRPVEKKDHVQARAAAGATKAKRAAPNEAGSTAGLAKALSVVSQGSGAKAPPVRNGAGHGNGQRARSTSR